ncbi:50S ribosomal protein L6 [Aerococcus christensenii]|uniref:Large ribosomal subunit protein uL6 n=1 Tax=Aerococcus christensenii TaxID=87541 RepID=A0A0X8F8N0_9LACT|nr:50S ribosomal protein L6 [Aerococcus christensenii]AMB92608.1 50S ribosomal protein L6 [Aerococcus christensenii]KXB35868.1 ribosomal protein L6 [Aerococcus christensenii]MDK8233848.1 50S ribosomal protein L6 [Aerococcus christensenii]PKY90917.1 50S ribosomal protein L6 [Aerococcus christensenii]
MSRIGKKPVEVPSDVTVEMNGHTVTVKGPKGELTRVFSTLVDIKEDGNHYTFEPINNTKEASSMHGTARSIFFNMVQGVHAGYTKELELTGVGYRAQLQGTKLVLQVGLSHHVEFEAPEGISFEVPSNTEIKVHGADKEKVGELAANIRAVRKPEPYKGKGIHYVGEHIRRKEGKTGK